VRDAFCAARDLTLASAPLSTPRPEGPGSLLEVLAGEVETALRADQRVSELQRWGFTITVHLDRNSIRARAAPTERPETPDLVVELAVDHWSGSGLFPGTERIAQRLAIALRRRWDEWVSGPAE